MPCSGETLPHAASRQVKPALSQNSSASASYTRGDDDTGLLAAAAASSPGDQRDDASQQADATEHEQQGEQVCAGNVPAAHDAAPPCSVFKSGLARCNTS